MSAAGPGRRIDESDLRERIVQATLLADQANKSIDKHLIECGQRYETQRADAAERYTNLRQDALSRHTENQGRMDKQDAAMNKIFWAMMSGMAAVLIIIIGAVLHKAGL